MKYIQASISIEILTDEKFSELLFDLAAEVGWEVENYFILLFEQSKWDEIQPII